MDHYGYFVKWVFLLFLKCHLCDCLLSTSWNFQQRVSFLCASWLHEVQTFWIILCFYHKFVASTPFSDIFTVYLLIGHAATHHENFIHKINTGLSFPSLHRTQLSLQGSRRFYVFRDCLAGIAKALCVVFPLIL